MLKKEAATIAKGERRGEKKRFIGLQVHKPRGTRDFILSQSIPGPRAPQGSLEETQRWSKTQFLATGARARILHVPTSPSASSSVR